MVVVVVVLAFEVVAMMGVMAMITEGRENNNGTTIQKSI